MTTINGIEDLARILRDNPDWADTIRSILLSQELLELPGRFAEFVRLTQESNRLINERLERLENDVGELKSGLAQVNGKIDTAVEALDRKIDETASQLDNKIDETASQLNNKIDDTANRLDNKIDETANQLNRKIEDTANQTANQLNSKIDDTANQLNRKIEDTANQTANQLNGRMDNGFGANYAYKAEKNISAFAARQLQLRAVKVLFGARPGLTPELQELVNQAEGRGTITLEQVGELWAVDLIFNGRRQNDGLEVYVAAEASITIGDRDINRASERAGILAAATGSLAIPAVIGARIDEQRTALAAANNVTVILMPEDY